MLSEEFFIIVYLSYNEILKIGNRKKGCIEYKKVEIVVLFCKYNELLIFL